MEAACSWRRAVTAELIRSERTYYPGIAEWVQDEYDLLKDLKKVAG
jgi:hypothetical protein